MRKTGEEVPVVTAPNPITRQDMYMAEMLTMLKSMAENGVGSSGSGGSTGQLVVSANCPFTVIYEGMRTHDVGLKVVEYTKP